MTASPCQVHGWHSQPRLLVPVSTINNTDCNKILSLLEKKINVQFLLVESMVVVVQPGVAGTIDRVWWEKCRMELDKSSVVGQRVGTMQRLRAFWYNQVLLVFPQVQWALIGALWLVGLALGVRGFCLNAADRGVPATFWDCSYLTLQLISLNSGDIQPPVNLSLQIARFLLPALAALTAVKAIADLFRERVQALSMWRYRGHVVICGLSHKGRLLAHAFRRRGYRVVVIEQDEENNWIEQCRATGIPVLLGDATENGMLRRAGVGRASLLLAVCDDDGVNAEIAVRARALASSRSGGVLNCTIHLVDPLLCRLLREREFSEPGAENFQLEIFNVFDQGARWLVYSFPAFNLAQLPTASLSGQPPHLLVIGLGRMGESLVVHQARAWRALRSNPQQRLHLTVIDRQADSRWETMRQRYPRLKRVCKARVLQMDVNSPEFLQADFLYAPDGRMDVSCVYICLDEDSLGLRTGLSLLPHLRQDHTPVIIRMAQQAGLASLLEPSEAGGLGSSLHAFGLLDYTCTPELLLEGAHESLARQLYAQWAQEQPVDDARVAAPPPAWQDLKPAACQVFRQWANRLRQELHAAGCDLAPLSDWEAAAFSLTPSEVESMARWEYALLEAKEAGVVSWETLTEPRREKYRSLARRLPVLLAGVDLQVFRKQGSQQQAGHPTM